MKSETTAKPALDRDETGCKAESAGALCRLCASPCNPQAAPGSVPAETPPPQTRDLQETQDRLHALFEGVETGIFIIDPETHKLVDANSVAARMVGAAREKIVGNLCHRFVCPADEGRCPVTDLGQRVDNSERVLLTASGERRSIIKTVRPVMISGRRQLLESFVDITELKKTEKALKERTAFLHSLIELSPLGMAAVNADDRVEMSNAAFERLFLYSQAEIVGTVLGDLILPPDLAEEGAKLSRHCLEQGSLQLITRRRRKDGTLLDVQIFAVRLEVDGKPPGILALYEDITERKRAEASLRESEDRFRSAFEDAPNGMCMVTPDGHFMHANAAMCAMLGYPAEELLAGAWQQITHPEDLERSRQAGADLMSGARAVVELEKRYIHKSGRVVWVRAKIQAIRAAGGEISHFLTQIEDITLRKQADEAKAFLASLVESSPDAIIGTNLDGIVMSWNHGAEELYGYTAEEMIGKSISLLLLPERANGRANEVQQCLEAAGHNGLVIRYETVRVRKDGVWVDVALTLSPVRDATGSVTAIAAIAHNITERRFREQQTQLQTAALESAANGILIANREGRILWVNPAFTRLTGYAAEEVLDRTPAVLKSGIHDGSFYQNLWSAICRGDTWHGEIVNRRKDGTLYDEEMSITPVRSTDGTIHHFVAVKQDITERKRAREEVLFKTALLETAAESTLDGILVVDGKGNRIQSNRRFAEILSVPAELVDRGDDEAMLAHVLPQIQNPEAFLQRVQYLYAHDSEKARDEFQLNDGRCIDRYTTPLRGADGRYFGRVWYFRDITDRKQAEQALRESEQRYRDLFENAAAIICTTDLEGRFTSLNLAGQRAFGFAQEEEALATDIWHFVVPEFWPTFKRDCDRMLAGETRLTTEMEVIAKDGRRFKLEVKPRLIWQGGKAVGLQAIAHDITGRDIAEMELRQAQKLESVGRLAAGIAHEINTPIQFIGDNTRFLEEAFASFKMLLSKYAELRVVASAGPVAPDLLRELQRAEEQADCAYLLEEIPRAIVQTMDGVQRVATIVRAMKEFAHPEKNEMAAADLNMALQSTITVARNEWKYVAEVEAGFAELPLVICNVGDLNQVFLNLLINAAHAIADVVPNGGKGRITVRTAAEGDKVHISIADTGAGIPEDIRGKIFDPFFTTKEVGRGTGQGLAIARSVVVDRHKGTLSFESEVGKGTTFHIRLPLSPPPPPKDKSHASGRS